MQLFEGLVNIVVSAKVVSRASFFKLSDLDAKLVDALLRVENSLSFQGRDGELRLVDVHLGERAAVHRDVRNLLEKLTEPLFHLGGCAVLVVKGCEVVVVLYVLVVDLNKDVFLLVFLEISQGGLPLVAGLLLENCVEFLLRFFEVRERSALMHAFFTNAAVPCEHNVKVSVRVVDHLHFVENVVAVVTVLQVDLDHVCVVRTTIGVLAFKVNRILLLSSKLLVERNITVFLVLNQLLLFAFLRFVEQSLRVLSCVELLSGPLRSRGVGAHIIRWFSFAWRSTSTQVLSKSCNHHSALLLPGKLHRCLSHFVSVLEVKTKLAVDKLSQNL